MIARSPRLHRSGLLLLLAQALLLLPIAASAAVQEPALSIRSGNMTGAYYAAASAVAKVFNQNRGQDGMRLATTESEGSPANIDAVLGGQAAFGIAQADMLEAATQGRGPWEAKPLNELRAVLGLHVEAVTIVARCDQSIQSVSDLRGKRINIGAPGSSDHEYARVLLAAAGVPPEAVTFSQRSAVLAADLLRRDEIDAYIYTVGHPNLSLIEASTGPRKVRLIPLDTRVIEWAMAQNRLMFPTEIPTGYYPGLESQGSVHTIGVRAVLFTRADLGEDIVYRLVREVATHFELFQRQHPMLQALTLSEACGSLPIPLHQGAARYCREAGLIP
jgi:TRAP transporter TAXI family solute receptor